MSVYIAVSAIFVASAIICHLIARRRGARAVFWGVMGLVFGPLAIPFVFIARPRRGE